MGMTVRVVPTWCFDWARPVVARIKDTSSIFNFSIGQGEERLAQKHHQTTSYHPFSVDSYRETGKRHTEQDKDYSPSMFHPYDSPAS